MLRSRCGSIVAAGLIAIAIPACQYSFSNPVERLGAGEVSGRTLADLTATGAPEPAGGVSVSLRGSAYDQVTHETGRFTMIPLPAGRHTLLFRRGTEAALTRTFDIETGPSGQPDGVSLGDVVLPGAASVGGNVLGAPGADGGLVVDETTGVTASVQGGGAFRLDAMSLGDHRLRFGMVRRSTGQEWVGGPVAVGLRASDASALVPLADTVVRPATAASGRLRFRVFSLHAGFAPPEVTVTVEELLRGALPASAAPDADGLIELDVPEGIYRVRIAAPPSFAAEVTPPEPTTAVVLGGEVADLGGLYLVPPGVPAAAQLLCIADDECGRGTCAAGSCAGYTPPQRAPAGMPLCDPVDGKCTAAGATCGSLGGELGACEQVVRGSGICVPCGLRCTPDGVSILSGGC